MGKICSKDAVIFRDVHTYAKEVEANSRNGMSKKGTHRVIGEIPLAEYLRLAKEKKERGEELRGKDLRAYLQEHPEFMTVRALDTGNKGQVRVL